MARMPRVWPTAERLSPPLIVDLLAVTGTWVSTFVAATPPFEQAHVSGLWAGQEHADNSSDIGREYTERWHHQMQIRDAVGATPPLEKQWFHPVLDISVRTFPASYEGIEAPDGTTIVFEVDRDPDYVWSIVLPNARLPCSRANCWLTVAFLKEHFRPGMTEADVATL